jgi:4-amino-4-deoxy-L-arabinose transferase-like glycosyltransferase
MTWPTLLDRRGFVFVLVAAWALAYLPNLGLRTLRLEEGRRATPAREMLASGDFIRPTIYGKTYLSKPPLYYWMVAAVGTILGEVNPLAVRIPSALAALGCALIAYRFARQTLDRRTRALAALFVLSSAALLDKGTLGEIDATLCLFIAAAFRFWWDGNGVEKQTIASWILTGTMLGIAVMLKGPAGPAIFYLTIGAYLIWAGRWRRLFTVGQFVCVLLTILPAAIWIAALINRGIISLSDLLVVWRVQLGGDYAAASIADPGGQLDRIVDHYLNFPLPVLGLLLPGILWLPFALSRRWSISHGLPDNLRRFLLCGVIGPSLTFYLYPESRPRHVMAAFFAMAILASVVVTALTIRPGRMVRWAHSLALTTCLVPMALAAIGFVITMSFRPLAFPWAALELLTGTAWSWLALRITRKTPPEFGALSLAATIVGVPLAAWFIFNSAVIPWKAPTNSARGAEELSSKLPAGAVVYTTRTFPTKGDRYFNLQFHLAKNIRAADGLDVLKKAIPCLAVVTPEERKELDSAGWMVEEIGRIGGTPGAPPEVHVIRLGDP